MACCRRSDIDPLNSKAADSLEDLFAVCAVYPSRSVRNYAVDFNWMIIVNIITALAWAAHAVYISTSPEWSKLEICEDLAIAAACIIVGVVFPCMADSAAHCDEVQNLATLANAYNKKAYGRKWLVLSTKVWPCLFALGIISPGLVWANQFLSGMWYLKYGRVCFVCWIFGMLLLGSSKMAVVGLEYAEVAIEGVAWEYLGGDGGTDSDDLDWTTLKAKTILLDVVLSQAFGLGALGGLWASRIGVLFIIALCLSGGSVAHPEQSMRIGCAVAAALFGLGGTMLLLKLGHTTQKCIDTRPSSGSLTAALYNPFSDASTKDSASRREIGIFFANRKMGIEISGVLITNAVVLSTGLRLCVYIPVASTLVGSLLH